MTSDVSVNIQFAQLMCSRLCHDIISPVGAVNAAVELFADERASAGGMDDEVMVLLARSASESSNRLAFFRAAFGAGGAADAEITCDELEKLSRGVIGAGKISLQWHADGENTLLNSTGKLLLMLVLTAVEALPRGGNVNVRIQRMDDGLGIACIAEGPGAVMKEAISDVLSGLCSLEQLSVRDITAYYAYLLALSLDSEIETSSDEGAIMLATLLPNSSR